MVDGGLWIVDGG
jgi:hypothetical protein